MMMSTATPSVPTCNGSMNPETIHLTLAYPSTGGIFGWKKRVLYLLLILLMSVVVINMALTFWIIKILDLSSEGVGKLTVTDEGIEIESDVEFLQTLSAKEILSRENQALKLESSRNVSIFAKDRRNRITNMLSLGDAGLQALGNQFSVHDNSGNVLLQVDLKEMIVSANNMVVSDSGGLRLDGLLQTSLVRGGATKDLRLDSPRKKVNVRSEGALAIESPAGGIRTFSLNDIKLQSTVGAVAIDGSRLEMKNLKTSWAFGKDNGMTPVYQVCMCENGRVFLAHREGFCQIGDTICKDKPSRREEPSWSKSRIS